ncbi:MAG: pimeloyl-ACP methyl ester esterase BioH [Pedobacter sp.]|nr:pimeloyl-ACP methyl ester esterase BioH [Pedobacter sp.]
MSAVLHHVVHGKPGLPELVLLHGWGLHSGVWEKFLPLLTPHFRITCVDLPGFGGNHGKELRFADFFEAVQTVTPPRALWAGWSLGGLLALEMAARHPQRVQGLFMLAATPCFVQREDWTPAMKPDVFADFADSLRENPLLTLESFLTLQCRGSASMKADIRFLQSVLEAGPNLSTSVLQTGLDVLARGDLRARLSALNLPVHFLLGEKDVLVPAKLQPALKILQFDAGVTVIPAAAHVPFVSHPEVTAKALTGFARKAGALT